MSRFIGGTFADETSAVTLRSTSGRYVDRYHSLGLHHDGGLRWRRFGRVAALGERLATNRIVASDSEGGSTRDDRTADQLYPDAAGGDAYAACSGTVRDAGPRDADSNQYDAADERFCGSFGLAIVAERVVSSRPQNESENRIVGWAG